MQKKTYGHFKTIFHEKSRIYAIFDEIVAHLLKKSCIKNKSTSRKEQHLISNFIDFG